MICMGDKLYVGEVLGHALTTSSAFKLNPVFGIICILTEKLTHQPIEKNILFEAS